jgi:TetR/AcrR family transcriptional regulator, transcriptional repressor for nem operon
VGHVVEKNRQRLTAKGQATRARILDTAAELMLERGVSGVGIEDVRRAAGVSGSQMTHYFHDKQTLIHEVVVRRSRSTLADQRAPELDGFTTFASLRLWADRLLDQQRRRHFRGGCSFGSLAAQLVEADPDSRSDLATGFQGWLELIRTGLTTMRTHGDLLPTADPDDLAYALLTSMQGGMLLTQSLRDLHPLEAALDTALTRILTQAADPQRAARALRLPVPPA